MKEKWVQLIAEHLDGDYGHPDRKSYLLKPKQAIAILAGDRLIEATHGEGYVLDIEDEALILRNLGEGATHRIPWEEINEISFSYAYAPAREARSPGEEKAPPPPFASRL
jgi:hypothetical protein